MEAQLPPSLSSHIYTRFVDHHQRRYALIENLENAADPTVDKSEQAATPPP